jgi:hypothetical protein
MFMLKKMIIVVLLNFVIFFSIGIVLYNKRIVNDRKIDLFIIGLEDEKILTRYLNPNTPHKYMTVKIITPNTTRELCYEISSKKMIRITNCTKDIEITLDEHAVGSFTAAPYNPRSVLFSEFLMGHIRVTGIKLNDILTVLKWSEQ